MSENTVPCLISCGPRVKLTKTISLKQTQYTQRINLDFDIKDQISLRGAMYTKIQKFETCHA